MNGLVVKDVNFNGAMLKAAQDINNIIWVGVRWVCEGIGLSEDKMKYERKKIQNDLVLNQGVKFYPLGKDNANSDVLCLMIDFLPLWLAKINITPKMQTESPELVGRLMKYQLKAKDVLADAFLNNEKKEVSVPQMQTVQLQLPTYDTQFQGLNQKIDNLYSDMGKFTQIMMNWMQSFESKKVIERSIPDYMKMIGNDSIKNDCKIWKRKIYDLIDNVVNSDDRFADNASVMKYIYDYMRKNYGVVWEQETKEYMERNNCFRQPATIDVAYENEKYRSIFSSVLADLVGNNYDQTQETKPDTKNIDNIIRPLVEKYNDSSNAGMHTYKVVYEYMDANNKISWKNRETRYINKYGSKTLTKKNMISTNPGLLRMFKVAVKDLLEE